MKKYIIIASLAIGALGYGQINTQSNPNPVINQQNPFLDASGYNLLFPNSSIGKGLYFPTTDLTIWEFKTDLINPANFSTYFDGMIVYNSASGQTIEDTTKGGKRVKVEPGFYYFKNPNQVFPKGSVENGEWIRLNDSFANDQEWKYNPTNKRIELVRSGKKEKFKNTVYYDENGGYKDIDFGIQLEGFPAPNETPLQFWNRVKFSKDNLTFNYFTPYNALIVNASSILTPTNIAPGNEGNNFSKILKYNLLNIDKTSTDEDRNFTVNGGGVVVRKEAVLTAPLNHIVGNSSYVDYMNATNIENITSFFGTSYVRDGASATTLKGGYFSSINSGTVNNNLFAVHSYVGLGNTSTTSSNVAGYATNMSLDGKSERVQGIISWLNFKPTANINAVFGNRVNFYSDEPGATINNLFGYKLETYALTGANIKNNYGLYLGDIKDGTGVNYAIYTGLGDVRFGQFKEDGAPAERLLAVDADGKLLVSGSSANFASLWANDAANNLVKLKNLADGTTARTDSGDDRNSVTINNEGVVTAKGFFGYNGAKIYPDYVFQKYYTGTSDIKANYTFNTLNEVESFVKTNGHLPGYQSAKEVKEQGYIDVLSTQLTNVEKIEELYLHTIEQEKEIKAQKEILKAKDAKIAELENRLNKIEVMLNSK